MNDLLKISPMGPKGILVELPTGIDEITLDTIRSFKNSIETNTIKPIVEVVSAYSSLLIIYQETIEDFYDEIRRVRESLGAAKINRKYEKKIFWIPVCYSEDYGLDLESISIQKKRSIEELIALHCSPVYTVYFVGFQPGFLYLGGLDKRLCVPRRKEPRLRVKKGAVGIGGDQTGIYPKTGPGGWQIIGNSPVPLFDMERDPPCPFSPGDKVQFYPIDRMEHKNLLEEVNKGNFQIEEKTYEG